METPDELGLAETFKALKVTREAAEAREIPIATEVPFTIQANETELSTLMCSPGDLQELTYGFLFTSGFIAAADEVASYSLDRRKWLATVQMKNDPDPAILNKRLYTSGCGKGVMYSSINEISSRTPLAEGVSVTKETVLGLMKWFQTSSPLHKETRGVHTAAISRNGNKPEIRIDDVGRHNAVDKVIGKALMEGYDLTQCLLVGTGRISSEILHKAKKCGIAMIVSLGAPTHQALLLAGVMKVTIVSFAKGSSFSVFTHPERIAT